MCACVSMCVYGFVSGKHNEKWIRKIMIPYKTKQSVAEIAPLERIPRRVGLVSPTLPPVFETVVCGLFKDSTPTELLAPKMQHHTAVRYEKVRKKKLA